MPNSKNKLLLVGLIAALALTQIPVFAKGVAGKGHFVAAKTPALKRLTPQEDLSVEPDPSEVFDQAVREYAAGHMPQAEKLFEKVLSIDASNADAHFNMGAIKEWGNNLPAALSHYQAALQLKPGDREIQEAVTAVRYKLRNKTAIDAQAGRQRQAQEVATHSEMARSAFANENYTEAISHLNYLSKAMPEDAKVQFALAQSLRALKYYDWAAYRFKLAIYLDPDNDLYRKSLVDLDKEIDDAQSLAMRESAEMALRHVQPFVFPELAQTGVKRHAF
jgi:tetratricopeptide (TPR) repeat protein